MLLYRAVLAEAPAAVIAITLRRVVGASGALFGVGEAYRVTLRYASRAGKVKVHRGRVVAGLEPAAAVGAGLAVAGYQIDGQEVLVSLAPVGAASGGAASPPPATGDLSLADHVALPLTLTAWSVTRLTAVRLTLMAAVSQQGSALLVRGTLAALLQTPGGELQLRVPFLRVLPLPDGVRGGGQLRRWRVAAAVEGVQARVEPGGRIEGEARVRLRLAGEGSPAAPAALATPAAPSGLRLVRELVGRAARVKARWTGPGQVMVEGRLELDLYWVDDQGASRWTGHTLPFSMLLDASGPGANEGDRLEATARVERLMHRVTAGAVTVEALLQVAVTLLRDRIGTLGGEHYRLQQVLGSLTGPLLLRERLQPAEPAAVTAGQGRGERGRLWQSVEQTTWEPDEAGQARRQPDGWVDLPGPVRHLLNVAVSGGEGPVVQALVLLQPGGAHLVTGRLEAGPAGSALPGARQAAGLLAVPMLAGDRWRLHLWTDREGE